MQEPVDYPIIDPARDARFTMDELRYSVQLDRQTPESVSSAQLPQADPSSVDTRLWPKPIFKSTRRPTPQPLADIAHSLQAGELSNGKGDSSSVFSRLIRVIR